MYGIKSGVSEPCTIFLILIEPALKIFAVLFLSSESFASDRSFIKTIQNANSDAVECWMGFNAMFSTFTFILTFTLQLAAYVFYCECSCFSCFLNFNNSSDSDAPSNNASGIDCVRKHYTHLECVHIKIAM